MAIINQIVKGGGTTPTGSISITNNGTYDVTDKATAVVNVPTTAPALYREFQLDANGKLEQNKTTTHIMDFTGVTNISDYMLVSAYSGNTAITGAVDMSDLTKISGTNACYYMFAVTGITSIDLSSLTTVSGGNACNYMFYDCLSLTSANLSSLTTISGNNACSNMFTNCSTITSVDLSSLTTISGSNGCSSMFANCKQLTSVDLSSLTTISAYGACNYMFYNCILLATVYIGGTTAIDFGGKTGVFNSMFQNCQNIDVYAPAANQSQIESFSGYPNFGATGTVTWHWRS